MAGDVFFYENAFSSSRSYLLLMSPAHEQRIMRTRSHITLQSGVHSM